MEPSKNNRYDTILQEVKEQVQNAHTQIETRQKLISLIEQKRESKLLVYVSKLDYMINYDDIQIIGAMLDSVGETDNIELLIQSGGGVGEVAEKIVDMIRQYCRKEFRVVVPNLAKSAATMIALAADKIIMGVSSELGPIDPQLPTVQGGTQFYVSAQSFIDARNRLEEKTREAVLNKEPFQPYIAQLSALDSGFIDHCEKAMAFAKDFATKSLEKYMLRNKQGSHDLAERIALDLCSASKYFSHGRTISAQVIKSTSPLNELDVENLPKESEDWGLLFELYLRSELFLDMDNQPKQRKGKLYESASFHMTSHYPA